MVHCKRKKNKTNADYRIHIYRYSDIGLMNYLAELSTLFLLQLFPLLWLGFFSQFLHSQPESLGALWLEDSANTPLYTAEIFSSSFPFFPEMSSFRGKKRALLCWSTQLSILWKTILCSCWNYIHTCLHYSFPSSFQAQPPASSHIEEEDRLFHEDWESQNGQRVFLLTMVKNYSVKKLTLTYSLEDLKNTNIIIS